MYLCIQPSRHSKVTTAVVQVGLATDRTVTGFTFTQNLSTTASWELPFRIQRKAQETGNVIFWLQSLPHALEKVMYEAVRVKPNCSGYLRKEKVPET